MASKTNRGSTRGTKRGPNRRAKRGLPLAGLVLLACLPLQGCFTAGLWATPASGEAKASLTPLTLALDVVTLPAQIAVWGGGHHHHRAHPQPRLRRRRHR